MRFSRFPFIAAMLVVTPVFASSNAPQLGAEYTILSIPQPSQNANKKVEVIEFFMYHCPYCRALEPSLQQWVSKQGSKIMFRRIPVPYQGASDPEAHLFFTLQAMGKSEKYQATLFEAIGDIVRRKRSETLSEQEILDVAYKLPEIEKAKFIETWNSFGVKTMLSRLPDIVSSHYKIESTPTVVIDGRYVTSPGKVAETTRIRNEQQLFQETLQVVGVLVTTAYKSK